MTMLTLPVYDRTGQEVGTYEIDPAEIAPRISKQLLHDVVVMYQANLRQGTFRSKARGEVSGTTKKMYRQKGTGNARAGSRRSPVRRGGGHAFAKRPRDFGYRLPKQAVRLATRMALASRLADNEVKLLDDLSVTEPKTREVASALKALKLNGVRVLLAVQGHDANLYKSTRNIAEVDLLPVSDLNALAILKPRTVVMTRSALDAFRAKVKAEAKPPRPEQASEAEAQ
jgi:large subunit ribosomal protein L4